MAFFSSHVENASLVLKVCAPLHSKLVLVHLLFIYYSVRAMLRVCGYFNACTACLYSCKVFTQNTAR